MISKEDFDNWRVDMIVFLKKDNRPMTVDKFLMDDFDQVHFCDRLECSWYDGKELKREIFNYDQIDIVGVHFQI